MTHAERLEQLYVFAVFMLGSREEAFASVSAVTAQHPGDPERWLPALVMSFIADRRAPRADRFAELDDILRTNSTIPIDLSHPMIAGDVGRMSVLLSELRRTCLLATLRGIAVKRRAVFILRHILGLLCADLLPHLRRRAAGGLRLQVTRILPVVHGPADGRGRGAAGGPRAAEGGLPTGRAAGRAAGLDRRGARRVARQ